MPSAAANAAGRCDELASTPPAVREITEEQECAVEDLSYNV
jgi:hypothetical protein